MADVTLSLTTEQITDLCEVLSHIVDETDFMVELHQRFKALQDKLEPFAEPVDVDVDHDIDPALLVSPILAVENDDGSLRYYPFV